MKSLVIVLAFPAVLFAAETKKLYYAHDVVADKNGVIAPWYKGQNGQVDWRVRIAAETLKRYPWVEPPQVPEAAPAYVYSGHWKIAPDGTISIPPLSDWDNGDYGQRAAYVLGGFVDYYRYTGDPAAIAHITCQADVLLDHGLTPETHPWPRFPITVPVKGKPFGDCDPAGMIQLDIAAEIGVPLIHAAQLTGNQRYLDAARHWGDLLAAHCNRKLGEPPWNRYANPEAAPWSEDQQTGGVVFILAFLDELIRDGYSGANGELIEARDAGRRYLNDALLPKWAINDTWGHNYWDWNDPVQAENVTEFTGRYLMENPEAFPNWKTDARNILTLFLNHTSVNPDSGGNVFHGAWAYPESNACCGRSLWYGPMELANAFAEYAALTDSEWARELARRQMILATYDGLETGVVEDNIDGGAIVAGEWFKIAHPMALKHCLAAIAWMPEVFAPPRENHIVRSTAVIAWVQYGNDYVSFGTRDRAAAGNALTTLRLAFVPAKVITSPFELHEQADLTSNSYRIQRLPDGDCILSVRHDREWRVEIVGNEALADRAVGEVPQEALKYSSGWTDAGPHWKDRAVLGTRYSTSAAGATVEGTFEGNRVSVMGISSVRGGKADVYLDGVKQAVGIDAWCPLSNSGLLYYRNGLANGRHSLKVVVRGERNPRSQGTSIDVHRLVCSATAAPQAFGEGGGPTDVQRLIFGYTGRADFVDSHGHAWRPGTEFIIRAGAMSDSVEKSWWTERRRLAITGTDDPELYRYGIHGREFNVDVTVGPGTYYARLKFAETRNVEAKLRTVTVQINGREVAANMDITATAGGMYKAVDVVVPDIAPANGVIDLHFVGPPGGEAMLQALEVGPGDGGQGVRPVSLTTTTKPG